MANTHSSLAVFPRNLQYVYQQKNPDKIGDVAKLMVKYKGKEAALYKAMVKKYDLEESFFHGMHVEEESSEEESEEEDEDGDEGEEAESKPAPLQMNSAMVEKRVLAIYEEKNPTKVDDVPKLMIKYKGKEAALYKAILTKYEIGPDFFAAEDAAIRAEAELAAELAADPAEQARCVKRGHCPTACQSRNMSRCLLQSCRLSPPFIVCLYCCFLVVNFSVSFAGC